MSEYKIAHIKEQGVNLIIIPLESSFGSKSEDDQNDIIAALQNCAAAADLAGTVIPVWRSGSSHRFIGPPNWHPFLKSFTWNAIMRSINKRLTCG